MTATMSRSSTFAGDICEKRGSVEEVRQLANTQAHMTSAAMDGVMVKASTERVADPLIDVALASKEKKAADEQQRAMKEHDSLQVEFLQPAMLTEQMTVLGLDTSFVNGHKQENAGNVSMGLTDTADSPLAVTLTTGARFDFRFRPWPPAVGFAELGRSITH